MSTRAGTLGDAMASQRAKKGDGFPIKLSPKEAEAWERVGAYMRRMPDESVHQACSACGVKPDNYYKARRKLVASEKEAFGGGTATDNITPDLPVVKNAPKPTRQPLDLSDWPEAWTYEKKLAAYDEVQVLIGEEGITEHDAAGRAGLAPDVYLTVKMEVEERQAREAEERHHAKRPDKAKNRELAEAFAVAVDRVLERRAPLVPPTVAAPEPPPAPKVFKDHAALNVLLDTLSGLAPGDARRVLRAALAFYET